MSHLDEVVARVDAAIAESVISHMNELLIALSDDAGLGREERYVQQQRLRNAIAHHGRQQHEEQEARRDSLVTPLELAPGHQPGADNQHHRPAERAKQRA